MASPVILVKRSLRRHALGWIVFAIVALLVLAFIAGFRPGPGLTIVRVGTLTVTDIPAGTSIFVDQAFRGTADGTSISADLVPGTHSLIVDAPDKEPWNTVVTIAPREENVQHPILVPKAVNRTLLSDADATAAAQAVAATALPTDAAPLVVGCTAISLSDNRVIASPTEGCETPEFLCTEGTCAPTIVYSPVAPVRSILPFPGRTDALLIATGEWVYVIDIDPRNPQFFAPIAHGDTPTIGPKDDASLYLQNQGKYYLVEI